MGADPYPGRTVSTPSAPSPGPAPEWVAGLGDDAVRSAVGTATFARGSDYATGGAVLTITSGDHGRLLLASVRGRGAREYQTMVRHDPASRGSRQWTGRCSCPMQKDCKHVVAVILTARDASPALRPEEEPSTPGWESHLADLVREESRSEGAPAPFTPVALQVEPVTREPTRFSAAGAPRTRLRLRPVVEGKSGHWVKTGIAWTDLEHEYRGPSVDPRHREPLLALLLRYRAGQRAYHSPYQDPLVHLDELGTGAWALLRTLTAAGVPLVAAGREGPEVRLSDLPAAVVVDVRRDSSDGPVTLVARLDLPEALDVAPHRLVFVGNPAHGGFVQQRDLLLLLAFARPLDAAMRRLLHQPEPLTIPAADVPRFLAMYSPGLRRHATLASGDGSVTFPEVQAPRLALRVGFEPHHRLRLRWGFAYRIGDDDVLVGLDATGRAFVTRDHEAEAGLLASVPRYEAAPGMFRAGRGRGLAPTSVLVGIEAARFAGDVLPGLEQREDVLVTIEGDPIAYEESTRGPVIAVSAGGGEETSDADAAPSSRTDWFDVGISVTVDGQQVPFAELLAALTNQEEHLILDSGTWFSIDRPELQALRRLVEEARALQDSPAAGLRITRWQAGLWEELVELGVVAEQSHRWARAVQPLLGLEEVPKPEPPLGVAATLRPYQLDGYHWLSLLWDHQLGGVLADDMGLGKTLQTLTMAARAHEQGTLDDDTGPILVVAPTSVVSTWAHEAARFCPALRVVSVTETRRRSGLDLADIADGAHLVVTSYALLRIDAEAFCGHRWSGLVLDEAQFVKNHRAKTYQAARRVHAPFRLAVTGTPLENSLMDLWAILSLAAPGLYPDPQRFNEQFRTPIESGESPERLEVLRRRIRPLMLRRTKEHVAKDLPPKIEQTIEVTLNPAHRRIYDQHLQRERQRVLGLIDDVRRNRVAIFRSLTLLRRLSLDASLVDERHAGNVRSSKIDVFAEQLQDVVAEGHRALVFSQFTGFLSLVRDRLDHDGIGHTWLDGRTKDRARRIAEFTEGDAPAFLISLKAGGVGLTITEADYVFLLDPWWNPAAEAQAVDRTHRIGQDKTVMVYRLVAVDTIEEKVVALQARKRDLFTKVVDEGALQSRQLTAADIRGLFEA